MFIRILIPINPDFNYLQCKKLYEENQDLIEDYEKFDDVIKNTFFYSFFVNGRHIGCILLIIKYSLSDLSKIRIYTLKNEFICEAQTTVEQRNKFRRVGRKINGKCLGTVALTKGLEFDTVIILDAESFKDPKELYVAMTRACKNLIIFSNSATLKPFN